MNNLSDSDSLDSVRFWLNSIHQDLTYLHKEKNYSGFYLLLADYVRELDINPIFGDVLNQIENNDKVFQDDIQTAHETVIADLDAVWAKLEKKLFQRHKLEDIGPIRLKENVEHYRNAMAGTLSSSDGPAHWREHHMREVLNDLLPEYRSVISSFVNYDEKGLVCLDDLSPQSDILSDLESRYDRKSAFSIHTSLRKLAQIYQATHKYEDLIKTTESRMGFYFSNIGFFMFSQDLLRIIKGERREDNFVKPDEDYVAFLRVNNFIVTGLNGQTRSTVLGGNVQSTQFSAVGLYLDEDSQTLSFRDKKISISSPRRGSIQLLKVLIEKHPASATYIDIIRSSRGEPEEEDDPKDLVQNYRYELKKEITAPEGLMTEEEFDQMVRNVPKRGYRLVELPEQNAKIVEKSPKRAIKAQTEKNQPKK